jgi:hypothetical protein
MATLKQRVRAPSGSERAAIFDAGNKQLERLDTSTMGQLTAWRKSLRLDVGMKPTVDEFVSKNASIAGLLFRHERTGRPQILGAA